MTSHRTTAERYRYLEKVQRSIIARYHDHLTFTHYDPTVLPSFADHIAVMPSFLPHATFLLLRETALKQHHSERSYVPGHKKGGTVSYAALHATAPEIIAFYHAPALHRLCAMIIGASVRPTPLNDQLS